MYQKNITAKFYFGQDDFEKLIKKIVLRKLNNRNIIKHEKENDDTDYKSKNEPGCLCKFKS